MMDRYKIPRTKELEFGGPLGAVILIFLMPATVFYLLLTCGTEQASVLNFPPPLPPLSTLWNPHTFLLLLAWVGLQAALYMLPMGKVTEGIVLRDKRRLQYRINAFHAMGVTALVVGAGLAAGLRLSYIYDHFLQLAFSALLLAFGLSFLLYFKSLFAPETALAPGGNSGESVLSLGACRHRDNLLQTHTRILRCMYLCTCVNAQTCSHWHLCITHTQGYTETLS
nr:delta(14)-sterol reductase-like [Pelodiscus sinensis]|eukprot:XP_006136637.1 delta(14)-sterol reductase-like [Pelodiscus sinensis]